MADTITTTFRSPDKIYDELLVLRWLDGDKCALEYLMQRWQGRLLKYACIHTGGDLNDAGDIVQEVWLGVVRSINRLDDPAAFPRWVYRILAFKCADYVRAKVRRICSESCNAGSEVYRKYRDDTYLPESELIREDETNVLRKTMRNQLSDEQRALLHLRYVEDMSVVAIGHVLNIVPGTVKSRLFTVREKLKKVMNNC